MGLLGLRSNKTVKFKKIESQIVCAAQTWLIHKQFRVRYIGHEQLTIGQVKEMLDTSYCLKTLSIDKVILDATHGYLGMIDAIVIFRFKTSDGTAEMTERVLVKVHEANTDDPKFYPEEWQRVNEDQIRLTKLVHGR